MDESIDFLYGIIRLTSFSRVEHSLPLKQAANIKQHTTESTRTLENCNNEGITQEDDSIKCPLH